MSTKSKLIILSVLSTLSLCFMIWVAVRGITEFKQNKEIPSTSTAQAGIPPRTPPGYHARVKLLTAGTAPFAHKLQKKSDLQPFLLELDNDSIGFLSDSDRKRVSRCVFFAHGIGSNRAGMVLQKLVCLDKSEQNIIEAPIDGYVLDRYLQPDLPGEITSEGVRVEAGQKAVAVVEKGFVLTNLRGGSPK